MTRVLQISDPHFGTEQPHVMQALLRLAHQQRPELTLLTGDITQRARRSQFAAASAFVQQLPARVMAVPGIRMAPSARPKSNVSPDGCGEQGQSSYV
jgi:3',5'-cyclic AMP phosphodiesterase CpdA